MRFVAAAVFLLCLSGLLAAAAPPTAAIPGEPSVEVTVAPGEIEVDASGVNPVDRTFLVNITGSNQFGIRDRVMWVNISFSVDRGWATNPTFQNVTFMLAPMESENTSIPVTITVPPGVSATNAAIFAARFTEENDLRFSTGATGNRTAQIHIKQTFSTLASFVGGRNSATAVQGQDANLSIQITNNGNGDAGYDAQVTNAQDLRAEDVVVVGTDPALVPQGGTAIVRVKLHANTVAITGNKTVQIRVFATAAGDNPPPGARADLTGFMVVTAPPPRPTGNNTTTQPPPSNNNTTNPPTTNPPPNPSQVPLLQFFLDMPKNPPLLFGVIALVMAVLIGGAVRGRQRAAKRAQAAKVEKAREMLRARRAMEAAKRGPVSAPQAAGGPPRAAGRPVRRVVAQAASEGQDLKRSPPK